MKTDIRMKDGNYVLDMELPGYQKENIQMELKEGYLTIHASRNTCLLYTSNIHIRKTESTTLSVYHFLIFYPILKLPVQNDSPRPYDQCPYQ